MLEKKARSLEENAKKLSHKLARELINDLKHAESNTLTVLDDEDYFVIVFQILENIDHYMPNNSATRLQFKLHSQREKTRKKLNKG